LRGAKLSQEFAEATCDYKINDPSGRIWNLRNLVSGDRLVLQCNSRMYLKDQCVRRVGSGTGVIGGSLMNNAGDRKELQLQQGSEVLGFYKGLLEKLHESTMDRLNATIEAVDDLDISEQIFLRARWMKEVDLTFSILETMKQYDSDDEKLALVLATFGNAPDLAANLFCGDIANRLEWCKRRIAADFERKIKSAVAECSITSPFEQIFLMEWIMQGMEERYGARLLAQKQLSTSVGPFVINFIVDLRSATELKLAIKLDIDDLHGVEPKSDSQRTLIQVAGYTVFVFSTTELIGNSRKCASEVEDFIKANQFGG
jgi:very-short-patch-repair endonuclease